MPTIIEILEYVRKIDPDCGMKKSDARILDATIDNVALPAEATCRDLSWLRKGGLENWQGGVLICAVGTDVPREREVGNTWGMAICKNPRLTFIKTVGEFFRHLAEEATISVADMSKVHGSAVIGAEGQGYAWDEDGYYAKMPQLGGLIIERNVLIGPNSTVMRGAIGPTYIRTGTVIGNSVNIGHGSRIGEHCLIVAHALIGGSAVLEDRVTVWQGAMIGNGVRIGEGATIGMGAVVLHDVPAGETWVGNPARKLR